jgi:hypothetical protein
VFHSRFHTQALFILMAATHARASVVFSNLGPGDSLASPGIGIGFIPFTSTFNYAGIAFTPAGQSYTLDNLEVPLELVSGPNVADIFLTNNAGGLPGSILESFHLTAKLTSGANSLVTIDSTNHPLLSAGSQYWIVAAGGPSSFVTWAQNELQETGPNVSGPALGSLVRDSDANVREALLVNGTAVPEPGSVFLATGLAVIVVLLVRRSTRTGLLAARVTASIGASPD